MEDTAGFRINALIPLLKDPDSAVRNAAAASIEAIEGQSSIYEIIQNLKSGSLGTKIAAIHSLGKIGGDKVVPSLVYCICRPEVDIRAAAVEALGNVAIPSTLPIVLERLDDHEPSVVVKAIGALSSFPVSPEICSRLHPFLEADDGVTEAEAAISLAKLGDTSSAPRIIALISSRHIQTREAAAKALGILPLQPA